MSVICLGLSHQTADVRQRERFAFHACDSAGDMEQLRAIEAIDEAVVVSTCNRVEIYAVSGEPERGFESLRRFLATRAEHDEAHDLFYNHGWPQSARHLFRVVCGLDSMVLGETEILGQVKKAYGAAVESGTTRRTLNKLFQRAFNVAKEVRSKTNITRGAVSVGSVAVELAERIFGRLAHCQIMILGAGETGEQTARALLSRGARSIFVSNRSYERAAALAGGMGGEAIRFEEWEEAARGVDILISSTAAPQAVVTPAQLEPVMTSRRNRPLFVIDLAVPRDVDPAVNNLDGVYLYDIDSLQEITRRSIEGRRREVGACEELIERHVAEFAVWLRSHGEAAARYGGGSVPEAQYQAFKT